LEYKISVIEEALVKHKENSETVSVQINQADSKIKDITDGLQALSHNTVELKSCVEVCGSTVSDLFSTVRGYITEIKKCSDTARESVQIASDIKQKTLNDIKAVNEKYDEFKSNIRDDYIRRNRVVFFGIPKQGTDFEDHVMVEKLLYEELGLNIWVMKTFRVRSGMNSTNQNPPLIAEFWHNVDKSIILNKSTRYNLQNLPTNNRFHGVSVAPDLSFKERQEYKALKQTMINRNNELQTSGLTGEKWIIKKCNLRKYH
ncbi:unnamed protein product, partial [Meganyctiphanes norvegica]